MKQRNTDIDWIRAILIILMILIHIVSFGNAYPQLKAGILSFMMPTFLIITGYLVNIEKSSKEMGRYLMCLALPYVIMVTGFSVLSYFMPVRDGITELSLSQICEKIFVTSIGPYWFIQTMIICGILYYVSFKGAIWGTLRQGKTTMSTTTSLFIFATLLLLQSKTPALSPSAATYYFIGAVLRQCHIGFDRIFRPSPVALLLWLLLLGMEEWYDWGTLAIVFSCWCCISSLMWIHSLINHLQDNACVRKTEATLLYIGRNTLPIYLFHPIFTMAAKFYHPLFSWDRSEIIFALVTIFIAIAGSIGIAKMMEKTRLAYLFGKGKMLR
ncbi:acyltransferase [Prevotella copri]|jgi:fucose 4-O-acetylase-like acetyltransferase|uniref:Acyltransferase n=1 Tax=Segatella copri TaxID=165179 RepID=A0A3E4SMB0_9BACT|nr:acyltransferase [Segatella copri]MCP9551494.1 acyltransferase [Segatella copri]MCP9572252.1 acyltransferase [Segatella copri]MCP9575339.1 acyltransferase [Segatella copri]MCP9578285.1 acyltransferase [Segatella copri]MCP9581347.1 acyltransferase [Segatella copri]